MSDFFELTELQKHVISTIQAEDGGHLNNATDILNLPAILNLKD